MPVTVSTPPKQAGGETLTEGGGGGGAAKTGLSRKRAPSHKVRTPRPKVVAVVPTHPRLRERLHAVLRHPDTETDRWVKLAVEAFTRDGQFEIPGSATRTGHPETLPDHLADVLLNRTQVAELIGVNPPSLSRYPLPAPDVVVGSGSRMVRGWYTSTILVWHQHRPFAGKTGDDDQ